MEKGWSAFFEVLRIYLAHFRVAARCRSGRRAAPGSEAAAWEARTQALGLSGAAAGEQRTAPIEAPVLSGRVERIDHGPGSRSAVLRLDQPAPGVGVLGVAQWAGKVQVVVSLFFYGDDAATIAARDEPVWQAWLKQRFAASTSVHATLASLQ